MYCCVYAPGNLSVLLHCAKQFSPLVEESAEWVVFDIRGLESLHGEPESLARAVELAVGIPADVAIAANPDAAVHAARGLRGTTVIPPGREADVLAPLSLNLLGGSPDVALSLDLWGVRTFGQFANLPPLGVAARLGEEGAALQELARGQGYRRLRVYEDEPTFEVEMELDSPIELLEPLCFVFSRLLEELVAKLAPLATNEIHVRLKLERASDHRVTLRLPVPINDAKVLLKILHLELTGNPPPEPVVKVIMRAEPAKARHTQRGLFAAASPEAERLEITLARVRHLVGKENVGSPYLLDTHRPDRFVMHPFLPPQATKPVQDREMKLCLRRFRPPRSARVLVDEDRPVYLSAAALQSRIVNARGPWRLSGDWWRQDTWNRDHWDVALVTGEILRLFQELDTRRWFIEGGYD